MMIVPCDFKHASQNLLTFFLGCCVVLVLFVSIVTKYKVNNMLPQVLKN